ncbi:MAG: RNA polymerase sigma factor [Candidatus Acidiferrales bacterium]
MEPDAQLVQKCLRGEGSAWEELVRRHTRRVFGLCYRFTGNPTEAEDLSQEVFLRIYRTLPSYRPAQGAFPTWLTSVTRNLLVDHYRRTRRDRLTDSIEDAMPVLEEKHSSGGTPDRLAQAAELSVQLQRGLARLSPELREAVILRDLQGLEYNEIQGVLQVPGGTVKSRINRGRIELARILGEMGVKPDRM